MRKPGRGQILENRLVGPREVLGGGDRRVPAKGRGRTAPCRGRSGASWIWATPLTPARARGSSVRATPSLRPPRILKTSLFLQKGGPRKEPSQRTATALFYLIPCGDFQLSPREFYLSLIRRETYALAEGELIHTENCHKYTIQKARDLATQSGFLLRTSWQDPDDYFSVQYWQAQANPEKGKPL